MRNTHQRTGIQKVVAWHRTYTIETPIIVFFSHLSTESFLFSSCCSNLSPQALTIYKNWMIAMPVEMELHTQGIYFVYLTLSPCQVIRFQMYTTCWKDTKAHWTQVIIIKCFVFCSISSKRFGWNTSLVLNDNLHNVWLTECFPALVKWKTPCWFAQWMVPQFSVTSVEISGPIYNLQLKAILSCPQLLNSSSFFLVTSHCKRSQTVTGCLFSQLKFLTTLYCDILRKTMLSKTTLENYIILN